METREKTTEFLGRGSKIATDILRVLATYRGVSWQDELVIGLMKLNDFLGQSAIVKPSQLSQGLQELERDGFIKIEERKRGHLTSAETYTEKLVRLNNSEAVRQALSQDEVFMQYNLERQRRIKEAINQKRDT